MHKERGWRRRSEMQLHLMYLLFAAVVLVATRPLARVAQLVHAANVPKTLGLGHSQTW